MKTENTPLSTTLARSYPNYLTIVNEWLIQKELDFKRMMEQKTYYERIVKCLEAHPVNYDQSFVNHPSNIYLTFILPETASITRDIVPLIKAISEEFAHYPATALTSYNPNFTASWYFDYGPVLTITCHLPDKGCEDLVYTQEKRTYTSTAFVPTAQPPLETELNYLSKARDKVLEAEVARVYPDKPTQGFV